MRAKAVVAVALVAGMLFSTTVDAKKIAKKADKEPVMRLTGFDTILYNSGEATIPVYDHCTSDKQKVAEMQQNQIVHLLRKQDKDSDYYKVLVSSESFEDRDCQYVEKSEVLLSGKPLEKYVRAHLKDFQLVYKTKKIHGAYLSKNNLFNDSLSYGTYLQGDKDTKYDMYYMPSKKEVVTSKRVVSYANPTQDGVYLRNKNNKIVGLSDTHSVFKIIGKRDAYYKIKTDDGNKYIKQSYCTVSTEYEKINNIVKDVSLHELQLYPVLSEDKDFIRVLVDDKACYLPSSEAELAYLPTDDCTAVEINKEHTYAVSYIGKDFLRVTEYNESTGASSDLFIDFNRDKDALEIDFEEAEWLLTDANSDIPQHINYPNFKLPKDTPTTPERDAIVVFGLQFLGNPYVYGGTDPYHGIDCSGFQQYILTHFGIKIGRCTADQVTEEYGRQIDIKDIQRGDLIYYTRDGIHPYHVIMYLGDGKCLHASCPSLGICIGTVRTDRILMVKNYID